MTPAAQVLLVEDNPLDAQRFASMFAAAGLTGESLSHATCIAAALELLEARRFDLAFVDLHLPDSHGLESLEQVMRGGRDLPVVVLTGLADEGTGARAVEIGAHDYLVKADINAEVLGRVIRYTLSRHEALAVAKRGSARAAAAEARLEVLESARARLEAEAAAREQAQGRLTASLEKLEALRRVDAAIIARAGSDVVLELIQRICRDLLGVTAVFHRVGQDAGAIPDVRPANEALHVLEVRGRDVRVAGLELLGQTSLSPEDLDFAEALAAQAATVIDAERIRADLEHTNHGIAEAYETTIQAWARALDLREGDVTGHSARVADEALELGRALELGGVALAHLRHGALLHDIGNMGVADAILRRPGPLDASQRRAIQRHTEYGRDLLERVPYLRPAAEVAYGHHERWDGSGYPRGLRGEGIPLAARVMAVVDVYDALRRPRPYRALLSEAAARRHLERQSGRLFDPRVIEAYLAYAERVKENVAPSPIPPSAQTRPP